MHTTPVRSQTCREGGPNFVLKEGDSKNLLREGEKLFDLGRGIFSPKNEPTIRTRNILLLKFFRIFFLYFLKKNNIFKKFDILIFFIF